MKLIYLAVTPPSIIGYKKIIKAWWANYHLDYLLELDG
jgi:hypothetical protein